MFGFASEQEVERVKRMFYDERERHRIWAHDDEEGYKLRISAEQVLDALMAHLKLEPHIRIVDGEEQVYFMEEG